MTAEPGHEPTDWGNVPRPTTHSTPAAQPLRYNSARHGSHVEESPELLRWRADLLMDEMMMGGVDVSAADGNRTFSGVDAPVVQRTQPPATSMNGAPDRGDQGRTPHYDDRDRGNDRSYDNGAHVSGAPFNGENGHRGYANGNAGDKHSNGHHQPRGTNGVYPSPSSSDHFRREAPRSEASHTHDPRYDDSRGMYTREQRIENEAARHDVERPITDGHSSGESGPQRLDVSNYAHDEPSTRPTPPPATGSGPTNYAPTSYDDELNRQGISAPRRYPEAHPHQSTDSTDRDPVERYTGERHLNQSPTQPVRREDDARPQRPPDEPPVQSSYPPPLRTTMDGAPAVGSDEQTPRSDRLYAVEQQYEQFRREQNANLQPVEPPRPATRPPLPPVEPPRQTTPPRVTPPPVDEHTQWATGPDKWEYQDFSADPQADEEESLFSTHSAPARRAAPESAVRHDPAQFVSAMSVIGNNKKRSTLLPRSTELDIDTLHREISDLHSEIAALLPIGNETSERARHLLDKAYSILQSDPSRSAEVEYYMQQVRTIVQRLHQSRQWSDLYRQRLQVYLLGWLGLSAMVLIARFLFQIDLEAALIWMTGVGANHWLVDHWATFVGTTGAGAFGGALGALYTMQAHARGEYSFFDRKYGLRGLILPFMGLIVGALGYVIFGLIFALVGINPSQSLTAAIVPTMSAFAFGFSQESIYGTRN